jgi:hypothetical protein
MTQTEEYTNNIADFKKTLKKALRKCIDVQDQLYINKKEKEDLTDNLNVAKCRVIYARRGIFTQFILMAGMNPKDPVFGLEDMSLLFPSVGAYEVAEPKEQPISPPESVL